MVLQCTSPQAMVLHSISDMAGRACSNIDWVPSKSSAAVTARLDLIVSQPPALGEGSDCNSRGYFEL